MGKDRGRHLVRDVVDQVEVLELLRKSRVGRKLHSTTRDYLGTLVREAIVSLEIILNFMVYPRAT